MLRDDLPEKRFLVVFRFDEDRRFGPIHERAAVFNAVLKKLGGGKSGLAFASGDGSTFGVVIKTRMVAAQIRAALDTSGSAGSSAKVLVVECGEDVDALNNDAGRRWFQH